MPFTLQFSIAFLLDLFFGDPRSLPHPVQGIGFFCTSFERLSRRVFKNERIAGTISFFSVLVFTLTPLFFLLLLLHRFVPVAEILVAIIIVYSGIACRDLWVHSMEVYKALRNNGDLHAARTALQQIVGRDTSVLDEPGISRACVETVAENLVDGVMAPLFWGLLFSMIPASFISPISMAAIGISLYKAVNTMDSMYGYKNERYRYFGTPAAKTDDIMNFIPARLSAPFLLTAAFLLRLDFNNGKRIFFRDRLQHASPNGGHPESAVAGSLGIQLGGPSVYFGKISDKPTMGDKTREIDRDDIVTTNKLLFVSTVLFFLTGVLIRQIIAGSFL